MKHSGFTQESLATKLGITHSAVSRWISGSKPRPSRMAAIANALGVSVSWLEFGEGPMKLTTPESTSALRAAGDAEDYKALADVAFPRMLPAIIVDGIRNIIADGTKSGTPPETILENLAIILDEAGYSSPNSKRHPPPP